MIEQIVTTIIKLSFIPTSVVAIYTVFIYRQLTRELKPFAWFLLLSGVIQAVSAILWFNNKNNLPLLHIYVAGGFTFLCLFYQQVLSGFVDRRIIIGIMIGFLIFSAINSLFIQTLFTFNSYALTVESILIIILSLSTWLLTMNNVVKRERTELSKSLNWINSALFLYYLSSMLIFYFGNIITKLSTTSQVQYTWVLHAFFSMSMYCCFFVALWHRPKI